MYTGDMLDRATTSFGISMGTGLMLESLFAPTTERYDPDREIPNKIDVNKYTHHFINIYTLVRNILNSYSYKDKLDLLKNKMFTNILVDELNTIHMLYSNTKCKVVVYYPNYEITFKRVNANKETGLSKAVTEINIYNSVLRTLQLNTDMPIIKTTHSLPRVEGSVLITTSYVVDLYNNFKELYLLESHTGKLKSKWEWYTKYHKIGSKDLSNIPFIEELLYILGDNHMVLPLKLGIRNELYELAINSNWTARTTRDKVLSDIKKSERLTQVLSSYKRLF